MKLFFTLMLFFFITNETLQAQKHTWELKSQNNGITVYFREGLDPDSDLKEIKISLAVDGQLSSIMALLHDVENFSNWVYKCGSAEMLKVVSKNEMYYYSTIDFPWPLSDRDFIAHSTIEQHPTTKVVTSRTVGIKNYLPPKEEIVRMPLLDITWVLTPTDDGKVEIDYILKSDSGGNLPVWLVNMAVDHGPTQTMLKLKELVQLEEYQNKRLAHIVD